MSDDGENSVRGFHHQVNDIDLVHTRDDIDIDLVDIDSIRPRGMVGNNHWCNRVYRQLVEEGTWDHACTQGSISEQEMIRRSILAAIEKKGGRFLQQKSENSETWFDVDDVGDKKRMIKANRALAEGQLERRKEVAESGSIPSACKKSSHMSEISEKVQNFEVVENCLDISEPRKADEAVSMYNSGQQNNAQRSTGAQVSQDQPDVPADCHSLISSDISDAATNVTNMSEFTSKLVEFNSTFEQPTPPTPELPSTSPTAISTSPTAISTSPPPTEEASPRIAHIEAIPPPFPQAAPRRRIVITIDTDDDGNMLEPRIEELFFGNLILTEDEPEPQPSPSLQEEQPAREQQHRHHQRGSQPSKAKKGIKSIISSIARYLSKVWCRRYHKRARKQGSSSEVDNVSEFDTHVTLLEDLSPENSSEKVDSEDFQPHIPLAAAIPISSYHHSG